DQWRVARQVQEPGERIPTEVRRKGGKARVSEQGLGLLRAQVHALLHGFGFVTEGIGFGLSLIFSVVATQAQREIALLAEPGFAEIELRRIEIACLQKLAAKAR